ncbi:MAG TPA: hypothetical protein VNM48_03070 [Chloroflexota bacterium]|nr:hypothetical protein [Chloroflexota bacterium]
MIDLGAWAESLGLRRKKTFVERMQDAAGDVVESVVDAVESVRPVLSKPVKMVSSLERPSFDLPSFDLPTLSRPSFDMPDVAPALSASGKMARKAWDRTEKTASAGFHGASDFAGNAASGVASSVASAAAATGAAAAGGASGVGGFFRGIFSFLWWVVTFSLKAAILGGIAYGGWQWLQSRNEQKSWSSPSGGDSSTYSSGTYGTVSGSAGASGSASSSPAASTPAPASIASPSGAKS